MTYRRDCWGAPASPPPELDGLPPLVTNKIAIDDATGCWLWLAAKDERGYGRIRIGGLLYKAHRVTFHLLADPTLPLRGTTATSLDHVADRCPLRPSCVNPAHLERVTHRQNLGRYFASTGTASRYLGVVRAVDGAWQGQIELGGRCRYVGRGSEQEVAHLVDAAAVLHGREPLNYELGLVDRLPTTSEFARVAERFAEQDRKRRADRRRTRMQARQQAVAA